MKKLTNTKEANNVHLTSVFCMFFNVPLVMLTERLIFTSQQELSITDLYLS